MGTFMKAFFQDSKHVKKKSQTMFPILGSTQITHHHAVTGFLTAIPARCIWGEDFLYGFHSGAVGCCSGHVATWRAVIGAEKPKQSPHLRFVCVCVCVKHLNRWKTSNLFQQQGHTASLTYRVQRSYGLGWDIRADHPEVPAKLWLPVVQGLLIWIITYTLQSISECWTLDVLFQLGFISIFLLTSWTSCGGRRRGLFSIHN